MIYLANHLRIPYQAPTIIIGYLGLCFTIITEVAMGPVSRQSSAKDELLPGWRTANTKLSYKDLNLNDDSSEQRSIVLTEMGSQICDDKDTMSS